MLQYIKVISSEIKFLWWWYKYKKPNGTEPRMQELERVHFHQIEIHHLNKTKKHPCGVINLYVHYYFISEIGIQNFKVVSEGGTTTSAILPRLPGDWHRNHLL